MNYFVSIKGNDQAKGTADQPFQTISQAAALALPGDTVTVHTGVYREWVNPANGGTQDQRILYKSAEDGEVVISGAERIADWTAEEGDVWKAEVPNTLFTERNPFETELSGDWSLMES